MTVTGVPWGAAHACIAAGNEVLPMFARAEENLRSQTSLCLLLLSSVLTAALKAALNTADKGLHVKVQGANTIKERC